MAKIFIDKITVSKSGGSVDLTLNVKGSVIVDKDTEEALTSGLTYIDGEKVDINIECIDEPLANYNLIRGMHNVTLTSVSFYKNSVLQFAALGCRIYGKLELSGSSVPKITITGGKKFASSDSISSHVSLPS